jgi:Arc/MetJ-type ribon-helix-helix transcriptional regulator
VCSLCTVGRTGWDGAVGYSDAMDIRLRPEIEELIKQDIQCGACKSVDEFVEHAVTILHEQQAWLAANREDINAKIADGYASAQRGELIDASDVRAHIEERKRAWLAENRRTRAGDS